MSDDTPGVKIEETRTLSTGDGGEAAETETGPDGAAEQGDDGTGDGGDGDEDAA